MPFCISLARYTLLASCAFVMFPDVSPAATLSNALTERHMDDMPASNERVFSEAKNALEKGKYRRAITLYKKMLHTNPDLDRVKLDLALAYTKTGQYKASERLLKDVLGTNPPATVRVNIEKVRDANKKGLRIHRINGAVTAGVRHDSNANSASSTGEVTFLEQTIPLEDGSRQQKDVQFFGALTGKHAFRFPTPAAIDASWKTNVIAYGTKQADIDDLDLQVYGITGGPEITVHSVGVTVGANAGITHIRLDGEDYLNTGKFGGYISKHLNDTVQVSATGSYEKRAFDNAPNVTSFEERTGNAINAGASVRLSPTKKDAITVSAAYRKEETRKDYFDNDSVGGALSYTRVLPKGVFATVQGNVRHNIFDGADPLISPEAREDREYSGGVTVGKQFKHGITVSGGYQYRRTDSNIMNYDFDNNRFTASVSKSF